MRKLMHHKNGWLYLILFAVVIIYADSFLSYRIDLTPENRFSLSASTKQVLKNLDSVVTIHVFLTGDLPSEYKKLSVATEELLDEFKSYNPHLRVTYEDITSDNTQNDTTRMHLFDSLARLGVMFVQATDANSASKQTHQLIAPAALIVYQEEPPIAIDLRSSRTIFKPYNLLTDAEPEKDKEASINAAEALLEYKFINAIFKLTRTYVPTIGYVGGNGEAQFNKVYDMAHTLSSEYRLGFFDLKHAYPDADKIDLLLIVKPTQPFSEEDKLKLDQYVMQGGKIMWFVDKLYAEFDSLLNKRTAYVAYQRDLNLDDILFKYGVRINDDLLQDLNCSKITLVVGVNSDKSPQIQRLPWAYYPFLTAYNNNPISKNLDRVLPIFPSSIDTIKVAGIKKTILLASDTTSRMLGTPSIVSFNSIRGEDDFRSFTRSHIPVSVLLEGNFNSLYANRISDALRDSVQLHTGKPFAPTSVKSTEQIVCSDGDIVTNFFSNDKGPMPMGMLPFEEYRFANKAFLLNCVDYLVSNNNLFESRNKDFTLRVLDIKKVAEQRSFWQFINICVPLLLLLSLGGILQWSRKRKWAYKW